MIGCSIGGRIVLHLALEHAARFRALIGLQSAAHADPYYDLSWLHRPDVHGGEMCGAITSGLLAPTASGWPIGGTRAGTTCKGGPGVFKGDLHFYTADGDVRGRLAEIDTGRARSTCSPGSTIILHADDTRELAAHQGRRGDDHAASGTSHQRGPGAVPGVFAAGAGEDCWAAPKPPAL